MHVVEARNEPRDRGLARAGRTDERDRLSPADHEVEAFEHRPAAPVGEGDALEAQLARPSGNPCAPGRSATAASVDEHLVDAAGGRDGARNLPEEHADHAQRPDEHQHVEVGGDDVADREVTEHLVAAVPEDADEAERREQVDHRQESGAQVRGLDRALVHGLGLPQRLDLAPLGAEALHDAHAGDRLLDDVRHLGEPLLQLQADRVHALREPRCGDVEDRERGQREEREAGAAVDEDAEHRDIVTVLAIVSGTSSITLLICWMSLLARDMS